MRTTLAQLAHRCWSALSCAPVAREVIESASVIRDARTVFAWIWHDVMPVETRKRTKVMLLALAAGILGQLLLPYMLALAVDSITNREAQFLVLSVVLTGIVLVSEHLLLTFRNYLREGVINRIYFGVMYLLPKLFFGITLGQHLMQGVQLNHHAVERGKGRIEGLMSTILFDISSSLMTFVLAYALLWFVSWRVALVVTALVVVAGVWSLWQNTIVAREVKPIMTAARTHNRECGMSWELVERVMTSGKAVEETARLGVMGNRWLRDDWVFWRWFILNSALRDSLGIIVQLGVLAWAATSAYRGDITAGEMLPIVTWTAMVRINLWLIGHAHRRIADDIERIKPVVEVLTQASDFNTHEGVRIPCKPVTLSFEEVSLAYPNGECPNGSSYAALSNVSLSIGPNDRVAIMGPSGAGKTSLLRLALGMFRPTEGTIRVNGIDIRDIHLDHFLHMVGYVQQDPQIFDGTIRRNLLYGLSPEDRRRVRDEDLWEVLRKVRFTGVRLDQGLDTLVGKQGQKLSGGQRQRLAIAAALIKHTLGTLMFLVMDEATSSLDATTERELQRELEELLSDLSIGVMIITHRLPTVRHLCNRFLVLRSAEQVSPGESQVEAVGNSFEELHRRSSIFPNLCRDQDIVIGR